MTAPIDLVGQKFGRLVVIRRGAGLYGRPSWHCLCSCGNYTEVGRGNLRSGSVTSCGCYRDGLLVRNSTTHGLSHTGAYASWTKMMQRCYDESHPYYSAYGGVGVVVTPLWHTFVNFYNDMGERPEGCSLDRRRNTCGYYKQNCRWATRQQQNNNKQSNHYIHYRGRRYTVATLARECGLQYATLRKRLLRMPVDQAVNLPIYGRVQS